MTLGEKIKKVRELKGFTQEHLASKLNMSIAGYSKIERDETDVPFSRLEQIADVYSLRVEDILQLDNEKYVYNIQNNTISKNSHLQVNNHHSNGSINPKERDLYEKTISLMEEKIKRLESLSNLSSN